MFCREDHQVGAQQVDKGGEKPHGCLFGLRACAAFCDGPSDCHLDVLFRHDCASLCQKGQHLEPFIQSFFNSCESPKPKPSRPELTILSPTSENDKKVGGFFFWSESVLCC